MPNPHSLLLNFLIELVQRLRTKKPKFFVYLQYITGVLGAITGLPAFITQFGIKLSPILTTLENKYVAWAAIGFAIASQLTSSSPVVTVTQDGAVLKQTDPVKMPFTSQTEIRKAQVDQVPNSTTTLEEVKK